MSEPAHVLVVAHQTAATQVLLDAIRDRAQRGPAEFHLVVPRQAHGMHKVVDPQDAGGDEAQHVLDAALPKLSEAAGSKVTGNLGDSEPLMAIQDAINLGAYDEMIISTLPLGVSRWLKLDLVSKAKALGLPVTHVLASSKVEASERIGGVKLATFAAPGHSRPLAGEVIDDRVVAFADGLTIIDVLGRPDRASHSDESWPLAEVKLLAPVPEPGTIYAIGLNYAKHIEETGNKPPETPIVFVKVRGSVSPPGGPIRCPEVVRRLDYEGELTIVIGAGGEIAGLLRRRRRHRPGSAGARAAVDARQGRGHVLPVRAVGHDRRRGSRPGRPRLRTWVNGELRQDSSTADLIFGCEELVDFIAQTCTLQPGDLILTGTPSGVGIGARSAAVPGIGDVVRIEIERLGAIEHPVEVRIGARADPPAAHAPAGPGRMRPRLPRSVVVDHAVDQAVLDRLVGLEEAVALHVGVDLLDRLAGVVGVDLVDPPADVEDLPRVDLDVGRLALEARRRLVDQDAAVGQREALALGAAASSSEPIDIAIPTQIVWISGLTNCIVS